MDCPSCGDSDCRVVDSRPTDNGSAVRRRRECQNCDMRFTTYERAEWENVQVRKRNDETEPFDRDKLLGGILRAVEKRPVTEEEAEEMADEIAERVKNGGNDVVASQEIGEMVSERLRDVDGVAYLRFVSVYKEFSDPSQFAQELDNIQKE